MYAENEIIWRCCCYQWFNNHYEDDGEDDDDNDVNQLTMAGRVHDKVIGEKAEKWYGDHACCCC